MDTNVNELIKEVTEKIQKNTRAKAVFGDPVEKGDITVIPVARVSVWGFGGGGSDKCNDDKEKPGGMGMGIKANAIPVGFIEIGPEGVCFNEITEQKRIILTGMAVGAFAIFSFTRLLKKLFGK